MADDRKHRGSPDPQRINTHEDYEVQYWSKKFNVSPQELRDVVGRVGPMVKDVQKALWK